MNRYKKANEGIHAPEELKQTVTRQKRTSYAKWVSAVAAVLVVAIVAGIVFWPGNTPVAHAAAIVEAEYPEMPKYPEEGSLGFKQNYDDWWTDLRARRDMAPDREVLADFYAASIPQFLGNSKGKNLVYSPLNVYMALAMLAETTDGNSRQQILDLLGVSDIDTLRDLSYRLWNSNYRDDGAATTVLASSLWLNEDISFHQSTMEQLADTYYASSYQGEMGSPEFNAALQSWLNEQTGGLLEDAAKNVEMDAETIMALATTLYLKVKWAGEFREDRNTEDVFHGAGRNTTATFMNQRGPSTYYWADQFSAYGKGFEEGGTMWFLLPDEGVSVDDLLADSQTTEFLTNPYNWENNKYLIVNFSMPKFDVSSQMDLAKGLTKLGVTDVFNADTADFSPMTDTEPVFLSEVTHASRVVVDEEGVEAAAFTAMLYSGAAEPPEEEVDFVLNRPFLFAITSEMGQILFVGVVNRV